LLLIVGRCPRPEQRSFGPRPWLNVASDGGIAAVCPIRLVGVQPPFLSRRTLPHRPQAIGVRVEQKDERVVEGGVLQSDPATDVAVRWIVRVLLQLDSHLWELILVRLVVSRSHDNVVRSNWGWIRRRHAACDPAPDEVVAVAQFDSLS